MSKIEEIILINSKLSTWNLIYKYFDIKWKIRLILVSISSLIFCMLGLYFLHMNIFFTIFCFIVGIILAIYFLNFSNEKEKIIIQQKYVYVHLEFEKFSYKAIREIQEEEFKKSLNNEKIFNKENLLFLIECIKREIENKNFKYSFLVNSVIILTGIYFGAFLGGFVNFAKELKDYLEFYKVIGVLIFLMLVPIILCIEMTFLRDLIETRRIKRNRLVRILENIYLEKYAS
ncbi:MULTISPECIES: hypothetical protein [unclassified Flavobacterium]|uniref:hypothetical protein n=1 Tax=unclassified Flavobacterium TaxID=196869 RepID=UPI000AFBB9DB|nr:hypothetical protein [Flavobacterium sp. PL02]MEA9412336.1 hypothetical protein [Flavobacterium sp. PL02]